MIHETDEALRSYLAATLPGGAKRAISFEPPTAEWLAKVKGVTLNLFLYDVAENLEARAGDWIDVRDPAGNVIGLQPPVRRYDLTYVASAWGGTVAEQHELLGDLLRCMPAYDDIPDGHLTGRLAEQGIAVRLRVGSLEGIPDLWSALGQMPVAALALRVTMPVLPELLTDVAPATGAIDLGLSKEEGAPGRKPIPNFEGVEAGAMRGADGKDGRIPAPPTEPLPEPDPAAIVPAGRGAGRKWTAYRSRETVTITRATKRVEEAGKDEKKKK